MVRAVSTLFLKKTLHFMLLFTRFLQLISLVPTDASIFQRLGEMYDKDKDKSQSFQYYCEV